MGRIDVVEADISFDQPGEPKTGRRTVPIPVVLVTILRKWIDENGFAPDHAAATTWLAAGVPLGGVARRTGYSVDTLVSTYVGALTGHDHANVAIGLPQLSHVARAERGWDRVR